MKKAFLYVYKFLIGGSLYYLLERMTRGHSHWTMFILGGACFLACGIVSSYYGNKITIWQKMVWCMIIITILELVAGIIINTMLGWRIWDYSGMPLHVMGQICVPFMLLWYLIGFPVIIINGLCDTVFVKNKSRPSIDGE